jgi:hypothetical protein
MRRFIAPFLFFISSAALARTGEGLDFHLDQVLQHQLKFAHSLYDGAVFDEPPLEELQIPLTGMWEKINDVLAETLQTETHTSFTSVYQLGEINQTASGIVEASNSLDFSCEDILAAQVGLINILNEARTISDQLAMIVQLEMGDTGFHQLPTIIDHLLELQQELADLTPSHDPVEIVYSWNFEADISLKMKLNGFDYRRFRTSAKLQELNAKNFTYLDLDLDNPPPNLSWQFEPMKMLIRHRVTAYEYCNMQGNLSAKATWILKKSTFTHLTDTHSKCGSVFRPQLPTMTYPVPKISDQPPDFPLFAKTRDWPSIAAGLSGPLPKFAYIEGSTDESTFRPWLPRYDENDFFEPPEESHTMDWGHFTTSCTLIKHTESYEIRHEVRIPIAVQGFLR